VEDTPQSDVSFTLTGSSQQTRGKLTTELVEKRLTSVNLESGADDHGKVVGGNMPCMDIPCSTSPQDGEENTCRQPRTGRKSGETRESRLEEQLRQSTTEAGYDPKSPFIESQTDQL